MVFENVEQEKLHAIKEALLILKNSGKNKEELIKMLINQTEKQAI